MTVLALHIDAVALSVGRAESNGVVRDVQRVPVPARGVWDHCRTLLSQVAGGSEVTSLGIAAAGPIDMAAGVVAPFGIPEWAAGFTLAKAASELFPGAMVSFASDGACVVVAEQRFGAARDVFDAVVVSVSSRITGGIMIGGFTAVGNTGNSGSIGHVVVPESDELCVCGGRGCLETVASVPAMLRSARAGGWDGTTVDELIAAAADAEPAAVQSIRRSATAVGRAVASAAALLDVGVVIVGGDVVSPGQLWWRVLNESVATHARISFLSRLRVVPSTLDGTAALAGAAAIATPAMPPT